MLPLAIVGLLEPSSDGQGGKEAFRGLGQWRKLTPSRPLSRQWRPRGSLSSTWTHGLAFFRAAECTPTTIAVVHRMAFAAEM